MKKQNNSDDKQIWLTEAKQRLSCESAISVQKLVEVADELHLEITWCLVYFLEEFQKEVKKRGIE